jgi:hypothetical protein
MLATAMKRSLVILLVLLFALLVHTTDATRSTYSIPLAEARWTEYTIHVQVPSSPMWARDAVIDAMNTWNLAQMWFVEGRDPIGINNVGKRFYQFEEAKQGSQVAVVFEDNAIGPYSGQGTPFIVSGRIYSARVSIALVSPNTGRAYNSSIILRIALHEFGHVLGLLHSDISTDVMYYDWNWIAQPSTLDLYAISVLAGGLTPKRIVLPGDTPYALTPPMALRLHTEAFRVHGYVTNSVGQPLPSRQLNATLWIDPLLHHIAHPTITRYAVTDLQGHYSIDFEVAAYNVAWYLQVCATDSDSNGTRMFSCSRLYLDWYTDAKGHQTDLKFAGEPQSTENESKSTSLGSPLRAILTIVPPPLFIVGALAILGLGLKWLRQRNKPRKTLE